MTALRVYQPDECGSDGYPLEWHASVKHAVREAAGHRCVRCGHPYRKGGGEWSPCDERCTHRGFVRLSYTAEDGSSVTIHRHQLTVAAGVVVGYGKKVEARWRILTVHHLTGYKTDCRWWNLAALCQRCHLTVQGKVVMSRAFIFEHSEWFKPYAAGWYAWKYERRDITRAEAAADLDRLLALERLA